MAGAAAWLRDSARAQLWPLPVAGVTAAVILGVLLPHVDAGVDDSLAGWAGGMLFGGDAGAARTVLDAIAGSLITVTSLTFSLTVVTLQLASSQFSPRLLRTFTRDLFVQVTLAVFLATFTYSLTVLRGVRSPAGSSPGFVPRISVTVSFVLAVASVIVLVLFLAHLARQIRVETMLRDVHADASATVRAVLPAAGATGTRDSRDYPRPPPGAVTIVAPASGFFVQIDEAAVLRAASETDSIVLIDRFPGSSLVGGSPMGVAWPAAGQAFADGVSTALQHLVGAAVRTGFERTAVQDVGYGLRQLTDVANKALSPGINDPTTAVHALGHISALLCELADHDLGPVLLHDGQHQVRAVLARPELGSLLDAAITQPRRYGAADPQVLSRLYALLAELAWHARPGQQAAITAQLARLQATTAAQDFGPDERAQLAALAIQVHDALAGRYIPRGHP
ncbi:MAG: DUF2254 domain-containing protein [Actinomycetota bacterium]